MTVLNRQLLLIFALGILSLMLTAAFRPANSENVLSTQETRASSGLGAVPNTNDNSPYAISPQMPQTSLMASANLISVRKLDPAQDCTPPPASLISWWPGDGNASDIQSNNHGSLQNGATFATGMVGQAFSFDGVDDFVQVTDSPSISVTGSLTIDAWVLLSSYPTGNNFSSIVSKWGLSGENAKHSYFLGISADGNVRLVVGNANGFGTVMTNGSNTVPLNAFTHITGVFDSASSTGIVYINGLQKAVSSIPISSIGDNDEPLLIGATDFERFVNTRQYMHGLTDEVEIFNRVLSQSEIQTIVEAGSAGKCKGVVATAAGCDESLWKYVYSPQRLRRVRSCVTVSGSVVKTSHEADGDVHIRLRLDSRYRHLLNRFNRTEQDGNMVVELICVQTPQISQAYLTCGTFRQTIPEPFVGSMVSITGALVTDQRVKIRGEWTHGWREIHPVTRISPF
jgi:hypothetical protein